MEMRRTVLLLVSAALAVLLVSGVALVGLEETSQAVFPGANGKIAFMSPRDGNSEIYTMNADGTNQTNITNNGAWDSTPTWSPDGTKIAFTSERDGNSEIYIMNADGTNQTRITNNSAVDSLPDWQPQPLPNPTTVPQTKADCKNGGYKDFGFKNQGQCIKAVNQAS
jgi:dipeptidyl aminopeptidase/acylaminoacyl peptidase